MARINLLLAGGTSQAAAARVLRHARCRHGCRCVSARLGIFWMDQRIENQNDRNAYLQAQIKEVDKRSKRSKELDKTKSKLLTRKQVIEQLQADFANGAPVRRTRPHHPRRRTAGQMKQSATP